MLNTSFPNRISTLEKENDLLNAKLAVIVQEFTPKTKDSTLK